MTPPYRAHPLLHTLADEIHARPPVPLEAPMRVSYLAVLHEGAHASDEEAHLHRLAQGPGAPPPAIGEHHLLVDFRGFTLKWERHTEFSSYTFARAPRTDDPPDATALDVLPADWLAAIPGRVIAATHVDLRRGAQGEAEAQLQHMSAAGHAVVMARIADGAAWVLSDFRLHASATQYIVFDGGLGRLRAGRTVQRLLEIEVYRMMALLAFPVAKEVGRMLGRAESELAALIDRTAAARTPEDERAVLADLTRLAAEVEHSVARTTYRFGAAAAYYRLVQQRIDELKEERAQGNPTLRGFMERRLAPALNTCEAIARRQEELSGRIARDSQLLRTRVDIELERQNQQLLEQMNRRAILQLRLQETVEGLSVVAITYYGSQLVHYLAKGVKGLLPGLSAEIATAGAIPLIAVLTALGLRRMRRKLAAEEAAPAAPD